MSKNVSSTKVSCTIVNCPTCEVDVEWRAENKYRPFCSERCKLIDLGAWADEKYSIASEPVSPLDDIDSPEFHS
ncbi:MAG: DNA gyrase inhibitor YacG [Gammaproteobacteria bacterium]|nr:DNA gyrase inhibitor YacG [Gammaproteobacteria bacterium]